MKYIIKEKMLIYKNIYKIKNILINYKLIYFLMTYTTIEEYNSYLVENQININIIN